MTRSSMLSKTVRAISKHSSLILSIGAGILTVGAVVSAADAASKTVTSVENKRKDEMLKIVDRTKEQGREPDMVKITELVEKDEYKLSTKEVIKIWALPVCLTAGSLTCTFFNHKINAQRQAALIAMAASTASMFNNYRNAIIDEYGKEADEKIIEKVAKKDDWLMNYADEFAHWDIQPNEIVTFYDDNVGYFETTPHRVLMALYHVNRIILTEGFITLTRFYDLLGVEPDFKHKKYADTHGWDCDTLGEAMEAYFMDIDIKRNIIGDDLVIYEFVPMIDEVNLRDSWI